MEPRADPDERRAWLATLTGVGRTALRRTAPAYPAGIDPHFNRHLAAEDRARVVELLQPIIDAHEAELDLRR